MLAHALLFAHRKSHLCQQHQQQQLYLCQQLQELPLQLPLKALQQLLWQLPQSLHSQQLGPMRPRGILQMRRPSRSPSLVLHLHLLPPQMAHPLVLPGQPNREVLVYAVLHDPDDFKYKGVIRRTDDCVISVTRCKTNVKIRMQLLLLQRITWMLL